MANMSFLTLMNLYERHGLLLSLSLLLLIGLSLLLLYRRRHRPPPAGAQTPLETGDTGHDKAL